MTPFDFLSGGIGLVLGLAIAILILRGRANHARSTWQHAEQQRFANELEQAKQHAAEQAASKFGEEERDLKERVEQQRTRLREDRAELERNEEGLRRVEQKLQRREESLHDREEALEERLTAAERREARTAAREVTLEEREEANLAREQELEKRTESLDGEFEKLAQMSTEEAREQLLARLDDELATEQSQLIKKRMEEAESRAKELATEHVARAIQRYAAEHTAETTTTKIELPDEEMKGRIIGKEGRNIRAFEQITGVDLIIDDTPGIITASCFDGLRREIAYRSLLELIEDGRIHPARIEEVVARVQQDMDHEVLKRGEDAAYECDVSGLHPNLLKLLGKLQFRTSYGQNVLQHTKEVAWLCGALAADMGLDPKLGRRCGLMHDIGKALDHEQEGSHPELGYQALKRYGENEIVANAALAHHEGHEVLSVYTTLAAAADAISAARPGARRESVERYIKRLHALEDIATGFKGVRKAFAIQAGRELRVVVNSHVLHDGQLTKTARAIARQIEDEVAYPGEVKVTVIREVRQTAVAR
ncbi:MAG: ribonuclease Y [Planctomycetota bacterium]|jgi:ribonuclease Y